tara:strand:+ start:416 stop:637 length:222 start_codon:yes stop_codon:yes gene_type:complete
MKPTKLTEEQQQKSLEWDADRVMEQLIMQESSHRRMSALVEYQLEYPDMTIKEFFAMASKEITEEQEELGYYE